MRGYALGILAVGVLSVATACASTSQRATVKAAGVERLQCDSGVAQNDVQLLQSVKVLGIEPIYSHVMTMDNSEERVNGAKLLIRPPKGVSAEDMTRVLQCHSARVLLGQVSGAAVPDDPYWLPDTWVNINVKPEDGNFAVTLSADTLRDNIQVLGRAHHYADDHMLATDPGLP
jgi:hypothetical protein